MPRLTRAHSLHHTIIHHQNNSMFSNNQVKQHLEAYTGGKVSIENTAQIGASFHDGWVPSIPSQYGWLNIKGDPPITVRTVALRRPPWCEKCMLPAVNYQPRLDLDPFRFYLPPNNRRSSTAAATM